MTYSEKCKRLRDSTYETKNKRLVSCKQLVNPVLQGL